MKKVILYGLGLLLLVALSSFSSVSDVDQNTKSEFKKLTKPIFLKAIKTNIYDIGSFSIRNIIVEFINQKEAVLNAPWLLKVTNNDDTAMLSL